MSKLKFLVINGPNLNMLGIREPSIYGDFTYHMLCDFIQKKADDMKIETCFFQSNHEGDIIDKIHEAYQKFDGIVINPGAFTHYSYAIFDALKAVAIPTAEVHISDVNEREEFRKISVVRPACCVTVSGKGYNGYIEAIAELAQKLTN